MDDDAWRAPCVHAKPPFDARVLPIWLLARSSGGQAAAPSNVPGDAWLGAVVCVLTCAPLALLVHSLVCTLSGALLAQ